MRAVPHLHRSCFLLSHPVYGWGVDKLLVQEIYQAQITIGGEYNILSVLAEVSWDRYSLQLQFANAISSASISISLSLSIMAIEDGEFHQHPEDVEAKFRKGMNRHIRNLGPNEWRIAHSHVTSTYLNESEGDLYEWRSMVEAQGCELINTVMLRDPLNHAMSLHKIIENKNATKDDWATYLESPTGTGKVRNSVIASGLSTNEYMANVLSQKMPFFSFS